MFGGVSAWQVVCISWSWRLLLFAVWRNTVFVVRVHRTIVRRFRNRKSIVMRHRLNCWWYIRIHECWFFLHEHTILNRGHHTEITVRLLGTVQTMDTPNGIQRPFPFTYALSLDEHVMQHTCGALFYPGPLPDRRNTRNMPWSSRTLPWGKRHFSANKAEVIRVIYALLGLFINILHNIRQ